MGPKTATAAGGGWGWFGACEDWNCHLFPLPGKSEGKIPIPSKNCQRWDGLKVLAHPYPTLDQGHPELEGEAGVVQGGTLQQLHQVLPGLSRRRGRGKASLEQIYLG